jgi:hypothetical protein
MMIRQLMLCPLRSLINLSEFAYPSLSLFRKCDECVLMVARERNCEVIYERVEEEFHKRGLRTAVRVITSGVAEYQS